MTTMLSRVALVAVLSVGLAASAAAGDLKLSMQNGRVTIVANDVPLRQILQEWARVGQAKILNAEKLSGPNLTLQLMNVPEHEALDVLLRSASGYIAAPRAVPVPTAALYDRITIMPFSRPPAVTASTTTPPPTFQRPPVAEDDDPPVNVMMPPQPVPQNPMVTPYPGMQPPQPGVQPNVQMPVQSQPGMPVMTAPRPGALPTPPMPQVPNGVPNPYQPVIRQPGPGGPGR